MIRARIPSCFLFEIIFETFKSTFCTERKAEMSSLFFGTMSPNQPSSQRFDSHSEMALTYLPAHRLQQNNRVIIVPLTPPNNGFHVFSATKKLNVICMLISAHQLKLKKINKSLHWLWKAVWWTYVHGRRKTYHPSEIRAARWNRLQVTQTCAFFVFQPARGC